MCLEVGLEVRRCSVISPGGSGSWGAFLQKETSDKKNGREDFPHGNIFSRAVVVRALNAVTGEEEVEESL